MRKPVYMFVGFMDSGKTTFMRKMLLSDTTGTKKLLIVCEEGEEEYPEEMVQYADTVIIDKPEDFNRRRLAALDRQYEPELIFIEYNGVWDISLPDVECKILPYEWQLFQNICILDAAMFELYIKNMPKQTMEKILAADMVLFNRCTKTLADMLRKRKLRVANRKADFYLEFIDGRVEPYRIVAAPVVDLSTDVIEINMEEFGEWYVQIRDDTRPYVDKKIKIKGMIHMDDASMPYVPVGHWIMTCCENDMQYFGILADISGMNGVVEEAEIELSGVIRREYSEYYQGMGPVIRECSIKGRSQ